MRKKIALFGALGLTSLMLTVGLAQNQTPEQNYPTRPSPEDSSGRTSPSNPNAVVNQGTAKNTGKSAANSKKLTRRGKRNKSSSAADMNNGTSGTSGSASSGAPATGTSNPR
jgi:hypothetical protein